MRRYAKYIAVVIVLAVILLLGFVAGPLSHISQSRIHEGAPEHTYASWDIMEFDKCVAAWLILRFIDEEAKFVFYPQGTEIKEGIVFDVPGAEWSRKHRICTSQCIFKSIDRKDLALEEIVKMAGQTELNFWQLERWPETQNHFYKVKDIMDQNTDPMECYKKTNIYFDELYKSLKKQNPEDNNS